MKEKCLLHEFFILKVNVPIIAVVGRVCERGALLGGFNNGGRVLIAPVDWVAAISWVYFVLIVEFNRVVVIGWVYLILVVEFNRVVEIGRVYFILKVVTIDWVNFILIVVFNYGGKVRVVLKMTPSVLVQGGVVLVEHVRQSVVSI